MSDFHVSYHPVAETNEMKAHCETCQMQPWPVSFSFHGSYCPQNPLDVKPFGLVFQKLFPQVIQLAIFRGCASHPIISLVPRVEDIDQ